MTVVDASVILEALLMTPDGAAIGGRLFASGATLHAPHLLDIEVAQVLRRLVRLGRLDAERGRIALADLAEFPIRRYPHAELLPRLWSLRDNLSAYDAAYIALAELLDAPLFTRDRRLAAAPGHRATVELA